MTILVSAPGSATSRETGSEPHTRLRRLPRRIPGVALAGLLLIVTGTALANPGLVLLGLVTTTTAGLRMWRLPWDVAVPMAALGLVGASIVLGLAAEAAGVDLLAKPWLLSSAYVGGAGAVVLAAGTRGADRLVAIRRQPSPPWWTFVPALGAIATGLVQVFSLDAAKSWAFLGTDLVRHMTTISILQRDGALDYAASSYPRGLHMFAALASVPRAPVDDATRLLAYDLKLTAGLTWFSLGLMLWTGAALTTRMGRLLSLHPQVPALGALILGIGALATNSFLFSFVYMGAAPSLVAVAAVWGLPLLLVAGVVRSENLFACAVWACGTAMLLSHLWQPLALAPAGGLGLLLLPRARELWGVLQSRADRLAALRHLPGAAVLLWLAAVPMLAVHQAGGVGLAATPGRFPGDPWRMLIPAVIAAVPLMWRVRLPWVRVVLGSAAGLVGCWLLMLRGSGFAVTAWYPMKAAWFTLLGLTPVLALGATAVILWLANRASGALARTRQAAFVMRVTAAASAVAVAFAFWLPHMQGSGFLTVGAWKFVNSEKSADHGEAPPTWSSERFNIAAAFGARLRPAVVVPYYVGFSAAFDVQGTEVVSEILSFQTNQPEMLPGEPHNICTAITRLAGHNEAVVISKLPPRLVAEDMHHGGCPGRAEIRHVPGQLRDVAFARGMAQAAGIR